VRDSLVNFALVVECDCEVVMDVRARRCEVECLRPVEYSFFEVAEVKVVNSDIVKDVRSVGSDIEGGFVVLDGLVIAG